MKTCFGFFALIVMILALAGCGGAGSDLNHNKLTVVSVTVADDLSRGEVYHYGGHETADGYVLAAETLGKAPAGTVEVQAFKEGESFTWSTFIVGWQPDSGRGGPSGTAKYVVINCNGMSLMLTPKHGNGKDYSIVLTDSRDKNFSKEITDPEDVARQIYTRLITRGGGPESTAATLSAFYVSYALGF